MKSITLSLILYLLLFCCFACNNKQAADEVNEQPVSSKQIEETSRDSPPPRSAIPNDLNEEEVEITTDEAIATIRVDYARIQQQLQDSLLDKEVKSFTCENDPGEGQLTRYYDGEELVLMVLEQSISHSWESRMIYLKNAQVFFVYEEEGHWQFGGPLNEESSNTIDYLTETRYYINDGLIIRQLAKNYQIKSWEENPDSQEIPNQEVKFATGKEYPQMTAIPQMMVGNVGC